MNEQERTALRRRIDYVLSLHDWVKSDVPYCICGSYVSDMDTHRAGAVEERVSEMLAAKDVEILRLNDENNRMRAAWRNARERARMAKSAWKHQNWVISAHEADIRQQIDFAHALWEELRRRSREKGSAIRQAQKWKQAYKRNENSV